MIELAEYPLPLVFVVSLALIVAAIDSAIGLASAQPIAAAKM